MTITANQVLNRAHKGTTLVYKEHTIAEITGKPDSRVEIRDIHGKQWTIYPDQLQEIKYQTFLQDLAQSIARFAPEVRTEGSASNVLWNMRIGENLRKDSSVLATLVGVDPENEYGPVLTLRDTCCTLHDVYLAFLPDDLSYPDFLNQFKHEIADTIQAISEPLLFRYFKEDFTPKILAQMAYELECWGDSWLMLPPEGQEDNIREKFDEYFNLYEKFGKDVPWIKIAQHAIIAQAREEHPEWLV